MGASLARPVIARGMMKAAEKESCDFVSHGCTTKGNDQVRFELAYLTINPAIKVIAPWRDPLFYQRFQGRNDLLDYAAEKGIPVTSTKAKPYSMDDNLAHCSYEAGMLEDPNVTPPEDMWTRTVSPLKAPDTPLNVTMQFDEGLPVKVATP
ncbi:Argininosuccinate synthase [Claviceps digitariae]|nr:Argininosuccinate synthase [Claviceps digitariae]